MRSGKWDVRISRSRDLALKYPSAAEGLHFYGHIAQFQKSLYDDLQIECVKEPVARLPGMLWDELDLFILLPRFGAFDRYRLDVSSALRGVSRRLHGSCAARCAMEASAG